MDPSTISNVLGTWGYPALLLLLILTGIGSPIPEDLLLLTAGYLVYVDVFGWPVALTVCITGVVASDLMLYAAGRHLAWHSSRLAEGRLLSPQRLQRTTRWFGRLGDRLVFIARLLTGAGVRDRWCSRSAGIELSSLRHARSGTMGALDVTGGIRVGISDRNFARRSELSESERGMGDRSGGASTRDLALLGPGGIKAVTHFRQGNMIRSTFSWARWAPSAVAAVFILLVSSAPVPAQSVGIRAGVSADPEQFYFGAHVQTPPLVDRLYFRPNVEIGVGDDTTITALNVEFAYHFRSPEAWNVYAGAGPALNIVHRSGDTDAEPGLNVVVGIAHEDGLFAEVKAGALDSPRLKFGVGYAFRWR